MPNAFTPMFPFSRKPTPETPAAAEPAAPAKAPSKHRLDDLTGGAFSAATSGERAAKIRDWLATGPSTDQLQDVFKELSGRDKGAARPIRDKLDELKRAKSQEHMAEEWAQRAQALLAAGRLNIADAMAWQRDAARAGAPLSREPLSSLRAQLADRVKVVEDLQNQAMVQREAAVLLAQRIELLSTKSWTDAHAARAALEHDLTDAAFERMTALATRFAAGVQEAIDAHGLPWSITRLGARAEYRFAAPPPRTGSESAAAADRELEDYLHVYLANRGVLITPFHNMALMCPATTDADVDRHTEVFDAALTELRS